MPAVKNPSGMLCIDLDIADPCFNLALEEYFFKNSTWDLFIVCINDPSVIIGKHQIANEEVNSRFISERDVPVIRRITGGGTVYHDPGNVNFTFIATGEPGTQVNFRKHTQPVTDFLATLQVDARFEGKNDIRTGGLKVSGNAEHVFKNRVLHHGTLLFDSSLDDLRESLLQTGGEYISRAVRSNRTSVTNLSNHIHNLGSAKELKAELLRFVMEMMPGSFVYEPGEAELNAIETIAETKYRSWEWNYAYGPAYRYINKFEFRGEKYCCDLSVTDGIITKVRVSGAGLLENKGYELMQMRHYMPDLERYFEALFPGEGHELALRFF